MTVIELIELLGAFPPDMPVKVRSRPGSPMIPMDVYPPFRRDFATPERTHVLIEEVPF